MYAEHYRTIAESLVGGDLGLLIGAGMSKEGKIPDGQELARRMLRRALGRDEGDESNEQIDQFAKVYPFEAIAEFLSQKKKGKFVNWLKTKGGLSHGEPATSHKKLHDLYELVPNFPGSIFTTNFDTLIEDAFPEERVCCITSENLGDLSDARDNDKISVIHLHGCIKYPRSIVFGERELSTLEGPIQDLFRAALATETFVLIGYSLADTNLRSVFFDVQRVADTRYGLQRRTFSVSPCDGDVANDESEAGVERQIWNQRDVDHIPATATEFCTTLFEAVENYINVVIREKVARALDETTDALEGLLETAAAPFATITKNDMLLYLFYSLNPFERKDA